LLHFLATAPCRSQFRNRRKIATIPPKFGIPPGYPFNQGEATMRTSLHLAVLALGVTMTAAAFALEGQTAVFDKYLAK